MQKAYLMELTRNKFNQLEQQLSLPDNLRLLGYMLAATIFFAVTLLASFFIVISIINQTHIPTNAAPNFFMLGLIPPSVLTLIVFTKVLGGFYIGKSP
jgi:hypothetical protein